MTQPTLFDPDGDDEYPARDFAAVNDAPASEQSANLNRVRSKIGETVLAFLRARIADGMPEFVIADLYQFCAKAHGVAPASPDRILRALRADGKCAYEVVNRRQSRYRVAAVAQAKEGEAA